MSGVARSRTACSSRYPSTRGSSRSSAEMRIVVRSDIALPFWLSLMSRRGGRRVGGGGRGGRLGGGISCRHLTLPHRVDLRLTLTQPGDQLRHFAIVGRVPPPDQFELIGGVAQFRRGFGKCRLDIMNADLLCCREAVQRDNGALE